MMNSLNADTSSSLNQSKFRPMDVSNQYYPQNLFYRIPNNSNISPEFASLQNAYGANQLLATQFSFQYSDNQGLGDGMTGGNHSGAWTENVPQSRNNPPIDPGQFYSLPSHETAQTADQNLYYPYGYSAANNMYWHHPSVLEYKSNNPNFPIPVTEQSQNWSDTIVNNQYSNRSNGIQYSSTIAPIEHSDGQLPTKIPNSNFEVQSRPNGYQSTQITTKMPLRNRQSSGEDRVSLRKSDNSNNHNTEYSPKNNPSGISHDINSLQSQMTTSWSLHNGPNNPNNPLIPHHPYTAQSISKQNYGIVDDLWISDSNNLSSSNATPSSVKAANLPSRTLTHAPNSCSSPYYEDTGYNGHASRSNYKATTNGFATGFIRPSTGNNNWSNNVSSPGTNGNDTQPKWTLDGNRTQLNQASPDCSSKSSWVSKVNPDEQLRKVEYQVKEIRSQINPKRLDINLEKTRYFVIKSYSEDDIHRSIKYKIWCSTKDGNRRLNEAFQGSQKIGGHVLLLFSVNGSGHFCGVAEMMSLVDENIVTGVWCQEKWRGKFSVKWLYVKDVPNSQLRHLSTKVEIQKVNGEISSEMKPVTNLRDATELKSDRGPCSSYTEDNGYQALKIIMDCKSTMSIFDDFLHYEKRELGMEGV